MKEILFDDKFNFPGFHEEGQCHIRILQRAGEKPTIICSQLSSYYGTSITNAIELIAEKIVRRYWDYENHRFDIAKRINVQPNKISLLQSLLLPFMKKAKEIPGRWVEAMNEIVWIEHYPKGTGIGDCDTYVVVSFSEQGEPSWSRSVSIEELSNYTSFAKELFQIDRSKLSAS